ncbi:hypothetical protein [Lacinutrix sp. Hel_I_90]|uniref:hypothetical protein n=1 Tax=Lacinutrix sp. Hel_I_90 TaxID=1249999 RepID=UPI0006964C93|nr:hypothetical protein [Lacinutrix sp. Hel_I_90]
MVKFTSKGIAPDVLQSILKFLNGVKYAEEINSLGTTAVVKDYYIGELVAQRILDKRDQLGGFNDLSELSDIKGFGIDKFNELVAVFESASQSSSKDLYEPLFRFASLRYHGAKIPATKSSKIKTIEEGNTTTEIKARGLSKTELNELEKAHVASLAKENIQFAQELSNKLENLVNDYNTSKQEALKDATKEYNELIQRNIKNYEATLIKEEKTVFDEKKKAFEKNELCNTEHTQNSLEALYPSSLFPSLAFNYTAFASTVFFKDRLTPRELTFLEQNHLLNIDASALKKGLNDLIEAKRNVASFCNLKWRKKVAVGGSSIVLKNRYKNGYVLSINKRNNLLHLSVITTKAKSYFTKADFSVAVNGKTFKSINTKIVDNSTRKLFLESAFDQLPELDSIQPFTFKVVIELDSKEKIEIKETVSNHNDIWVGQYLVNSHVTGNLRTKGGKPIKELNGILRLGWADLMRVEQKLCCYLPGEVSHIENIMAREYKEKSTEYLERSENTIVEENETETIAKNDTTSVEKNDWNKEVSKTLERSFDFGLGTTVSYGSEKGPWSASIKADLSIANSQSQSSTNAQSYSKDITESASESIRTRSFEKRTTSLIKQFKEENKHGFDNRNGGSHVSGVFRWIDKIYNNRIVNYGTGMLYEFMIPKPSELYVETLSDDKSDDQEAPEAPIAPNLNSWQDVTRDNFMTYINTYNVANYQLPKANIKYDNMQIGTINEPFDWANENKNEVTRTYNFNSVLAVDYFLEGVFPNSLANTTDWKIRTHNPFWKHYAKFQVFLKNSSNQVTIVNDSSFASRIVHEEDVAGDVDNKQGLYFENNVDVRIYGSHVRWLYYLNLNFRFKLKESSYQQWQQDTYNAIMTAYQTQLDTYNDALAAQQVDITNASDAALYDANKYKHPGLYQEIINTELKRLCMELLLQGTNLDRCQEFYKTTKCSESDDCEEIPMLTNLDALDKYSSLVKFMEQSFNWSLSSHNFYPYYWSGQCDWADMLHNEDTPDNEFQKFLKSGMARVLVPVREGFEKVVAYYLATGQPWFDGEPPVIDDPLYISIVQELSKPNGTLVGEPWNTNVPSSLTLIQGGSVFLENQGLPCCDDISEGTGIKPSDNRLEGKDDENNDLKKG